MRHVLVLSASLLGGSSMMLPTQFQRAPRPARHVPAAMIFDGLSARFAEEDQRTYLADPLDVSIVELPAQCNGATDVFIIFHGAGGPDRETEDLEARVCSQDAAAALDRAVCVFDWRPWFSTGSRRNLNSYHGQEVGSRLGQILADAAPALRTLHVVGTSAGAWPANEMCTAYVKATAERAQGRASVVLSLTDPFTARSDRPLADPWGMRHFGESADFAEQYLNTDDIAPSTNDPLPLCYCWDVTGAAERASFPLPGGGSTGNALLDAGMLLLGYHNWPMGYMARHYETRLDSEGRLIVPSHDLLPRGAVNAVL